MNKTSTTVIAIDGPSASGKSTVAKLVAEALHYNYVDTGAMYRALTWKCMQEKLDGSDAAAVVDFLKRVDFKVDFKDGRSKITIDGVDPEPFIRGEDVSSRVSKISAIPEVRQRLVAEQRGLVKHGDLVMEGRDIGTVVFADAPFKFFLDANPKVRAQRRAAELKQKDEHIAQTLKQRDHLDSNRTVSPLKVADDAIRIDTSDKSIAGVVDLVLKNIRTRHFSK